MIRYATKVSLHNEEGTYYSDIHPSIMQVNMCIEPHEPIYTIDVTEETEITDDSYWGWMDPDGSINMIYPAFVLMDMCFPYGSAAEEITGRGKVIRVKIEEIREVI